MIKNFIFDFGKVIVHFDTKYMVKRYVEDEADAALLGEVIFDRLYWDKLDAGTISDEEVIVESKKRLPKRLHGEVERIYYNWIYNIPEIDGMSDLVRRIKMTYHSPIFLLSNISVYFADHADEIPCLALFDRCFFSAKCGKTKPHADIFNYLCKECNIKPEETLFIDDSEKNILGAEAVGIKGYLFDGNADRLWEYICTEAPTPRRLAGGGLEASPFTWEV